MEKKQRYQGRYDAANVRRQQKAMAAGKNTARAEKSAASAKPAKTTKSGGKRISPVLPIVIVVAALLVAAGVGTYAYCAPAMNYDTIYPNVYVAGVNVGGMSKVEAASAVETALSDTYSTETMVVELPDQTLEFPPELVSVTLDTDSAIDAAWSYGRDGNILDQAKALRSAKKSEYHIDLDSEMNLDVSAITAQVQAAADKLNGKPVQASLDLDTDNNLLTIVMGVSGKTLDVDGLTEAVRQRFLTGDFSKLTYPYQITTPDPVDLRSIYEQIGKSAEDAYFDEATGEVVAEEAGYGFDVAAAEQRVAMAKDGDVLEVELQVIQPEVTKAELDALYFRDVLSEYDSPYPWNPPRTNNLTLAANTLNGTVVLPGKEFSFNNTVGERTPEKGYQEATVYVQGASVGETGGGVCQVASTIYYCALLANLEITQREEHMYAVTYVPYGMDATIYWGALDFRFRNNTEYPIRIQASVSDGYVHVKLIGTKTDDKYVVMTSELLSTTAWKNVDEQGRELTLDTEKGDGVYLCKADGKYYQLVDVVETAYTGYVYYTYRNIYNADGTLASTSQEDRSDYMKRDRKLKVTLMDPQPGEEPDPDGGIELPPVPGLDNPTDPTPMPGTDPTPTPEPEPEPEPEPGQEPFVDPTPWGNDWPDEEDDEYWP